MWHFIRVYLKKQKNKNLDNFEGYQYVLGFPAIVIFLIFLLFHWDYGFWEKDHKCKVLAVFMASYQGAMLSAWFMTTHVDPNHLAVVVVSVRFLHCELLSSTAFHSVFSWEKFPSGADIWEVKTALPHSEESIYGMDLKFGFNIAAPEFRCLSIC